jgi:hypothetical protein
VPNALEFVEGNADNCIPLTGCLDADRYQQVYGGAEFGAITGPDPVYVSEITFRPSFLPPATPFTSATFADVEIRLSTTPGLFGPDGVTAIGPDNLFTTYDDNVGGDEVVVYRGALTMTSSVTGPGPYDFDVVISLQTPFLYDPTEGNLLFEWRNYSGETPFNGFLDAENTFGDAISRVESSSFPSDPEAPTGHAGTLGLVTLFTFIPPEELNVTVPTPVGNDVPVIQLTNFFEQVATEVVVAGTTSANFCVGPDHRWVTNQWGHTAFKYRWLRLSELAGFGSCTGPITEGEPETWEELLGQIDLRVAPFHRSYHSEFTIPGDSTPTADYWMVVAVVRTSAEYDGVVSVVNFAEALLDFSNTPLAETPGCDRDVQWRQQDLGGAVVAFGEHPNVEGRNMIVETGQCNRSRSMTRRTTHVYPVRLTKNHSFGQKIVEFRNISRQFWGIRRTLKEAEHCADPFLIADMRESLRRAIRRFYSLNHDGGLDDAEEHLEEIARSAMNADSFGSGFSNCPVEANYHGNLVHRGVTAAFTVHDRWQHPDVFVKYLLPPDFDIVGFESEIIVPPIP